eukprot:Platyproteum_vivax@DN15040_c0_g1_i1.p1
MEEFGYKILASLVTDVSPDINVKRAMNEVNRNRRLRIANEERAEASKILSIKAAEAEAEAKRLYGEGLARQRKVLVDGMRDSISDFCSEIRGSKPKEIMNLLMLLQYFDTMLNIGNQDSEVSMIN